MLFNLCSFSSAFFPPVLSSLTPCSLNLLCRAYTPLHLLLGCAPALSAHVKLSSVLHLWLPPSLTHPISISMVFPSPSSSSISLFLSILQHFLHLPPTVSSQGYLGLPSLFTSPIFSVSPEFTPLLHLSLFHLYPLSALPTPVCLSLSTLIFLLSYQLICELSHSKFCTRSCMLSF